MKRQDINKEVSFSEPGKMDYILPLPLNIQLAKLDLACSHPGKVAASFSLECTWGIPGVWKLHPLAWSSAMEVLGIGMMVCIAFEELCCWPKIPLKFPCRAQEESCFRYSEAWHPLSRNQAMRLPAQIILKGCALWFSINDDLDPFSNTTTKIQANHCICI